MLKEQLQVCFVLLITEMNKYQDFCCGVPKFAGFGLR